MRKHIENVNSPQLRPKTVNPVGDMARGFQDVWELGNVTILISFKRTCFYSDPPGFAGLCSCIIFFFIVK